MSAQIILYPDTWGKAHRRHLRQRRLDAQHGRVMETFKMMRQPRVADGSARAWGSGDYAESNKEDLSDD